MEQTSPHLIRCHRFDVIPPRPYDIESLTPSPLHPRQREALAEANHLFGDLGQSLFVFGVEEDLCDPFGDVVHFCT